MKNPNHDALTRLPARLLFWERLRLAIAEAKRYQRRFALLLIDLDHTDRVNNCLGEHAGDQLLVEVAWRLVSGVRESDCVARLNDNRFAIVLADITAADLVMEVAQRVVAQLTAPYHLDAGTVRIACNIGIALWSPHTVGIEAWERNAVSALQCAKLKGEDACHIFVSPPDLNELL